MLFNSIQFVIFLPLVIIAYYLIPFKFRWILLLLASYLFYMAWRVEYVFLILSSTVVDYFAALEMEKQKTKGDRRVYLMLSLGANLGLLFLFKYLNFFSSTLQWFSESIQAGITFPHIDVLLPVGISFYTFQTLSYSIDVYLGRQKAERHFGYFAVYVSFFPQLVAGPIERFSRLAPQFKKNHILSYRNIVNGLRLILYGLFIKMVIADNLAVFVDQIYQDPSKFGSLDLMTGMLFYSFQIYSDFYGYSIIAIGSALMMDIRIIDNFKTPYLSKSIGEFWQRWHISLSTWFRDYLYFPLGGNKVKVQRWILNIVLVFLISGLWHGANWTFVFWGLIFGIAYLVEKGFNKNSKEADSRVFSIKHILLALKTFFIVSLAWVFFRSPDLSSAFSFFRELLTNGKNSSLSLEVPLINWFFFLVFVASDILLYNSRFDKLVDKLPVYLRWMVYVFLIYAIIVFAAVEHVPFIYFQF